MKGKTIILFVLLVLGVGVVVQAQDYDSREWSWKEGRNQFADIVAGKPGAAIADLETYLQDHPGNLEVYFDLAVAYAHQGKQAKAMEMAQKALDSGLPLRRFLMGPRDVLKPLVSSRGFQQLLAQQPTVELLAGPLVGNVTDSQAWFWVRTVHEVPVKVLVSSLEAMGSVVTSAQNKTDQADDYTTVVRVNGLKPDTRYYYQLEVDGKRTDHTWSFRTHPATGQSAKFSIAFGGGAAYEPNYEYMWNTIASHQPAAMLMLGDNVYIDHPTMPDVQRHCYYRRQLVPEWRALTAQTPVYAIYDDHDFTTDDGWGGPAIDTPPWKRNVWKVFRQNWNNPSYGGGPEHPGCYFDFTIADVHFIMMDCRYYRTDPHTEHPSMIGPVQKAWLFKTLQSSDATLQVLVSSVPWAFGTKPGSLDTWEGFKDEREEIFSFIEAHHINGVVLLSADRHRSDAWRIERKEGYPFYEFESSRLTNIHLHKLMPGRLFGYNAKRSFGLVTFDTTRPDPVVSYSIYNIDNQLIDKLTLHKSEISFPEK